MKYLIIYILSAAFLLGCNTTDTKQMQDINIHRNVMNSYIKNCKKTTNSLISLQYEMKQYHEFVSITNNADILKESNYMKTKLVDTKNHLQSICTLSGDFSKSVEKIGYSAHDFGKILRNRFVIEKKKNEKNGSIVLLRSMATTFLTTSDGIEIIMKEAPNYFRSFLVVGRSSKKYNK